MAIKVKNNQIHLMTKNTSYILSVYKEHLITHLYWGKRVSDDIDIEFFNDEFISSRANAFHVATNDKDTMFVSDINFEFSTVGSGDYREPTVHIKHSDLSTVSEFVYCDYEIYKGKKSLEGLPAVYCESDDRVETLIITLKDEKSKLSALLKYSVFEDYDVITRNIEYINESGNSVWLLSALSATVDITGEELKTLDLHGDWGRERYMEWKPVGNSKTSFGSKRGMSSHFHNPFIAVADKNVDEYNGNVYAMSLVYSGNFEAFAEGTSCGNTRIGIGINPFNFEWELKGNEHFTTPEVVLVYSPNGLNHMSNLYHRIYRDRLCRGKYRDMIRPIVINNWEGTGFDFTEEQIVEIARTGAEIGLELFVLDDGWFGVRNDDKNSLGDWYTNKEKLPNGLNGLSEKIKESGIGFGIWMEPEMISPDSELYRKHPDWCIHASGRHRTQNRWQYVLDLTKTEVKDYVFNCVANIIRESNVSYVKWDCNRNITETANMEQSHRYVLALYEILDRLNIEFPDVLFEGCSGGGGRFDPGMLYYMPQTWTSDNTNPLNRLKIQYGTSIVYPVITMTAHVGNIKIGENVENKYLKSCADVAMSCNFGFELVISELSDIEKKQAKDGVDLYKSIRKTIQFGDMYRHENPFESDFASVEYVNEDKSQIVLFCYQTESKFNEKERRIFIKGADKNNDYVVNGKKYCGEVLLNKGFRIPLDTYNHHSSVFVFEKN